MKWSLAAQRRNSCASRLPVSSTGIRRVAKGGVYISDKVAELMVRGMRPAAEPQPHNLLSDREFQVFNMLVAGRSVTEIGALLSLSVKTISTHKTHILQK